MTVLGEIIDKLASGGTTLETYGRQGDCIARMDSRAFVAAVRRCRRRLSGWSTESHGGRKVVGLFFKPEETIEFLIAALAAMAERFTVVPFYPNWSAEVQRRYLQLYRVRAAAVGEGFRKRVEGWGEDLDRVIPVSLSIAGEPDDDAGEAPLDFDLPADHPCAWIFTSGTAGAVPKCTVISLENIAAAVENMQRLDFLFEGMALHSPLSTSHIFAFVVVLGILAIKPRRFLFSDVQFLARLPEDRIGRIDGIILVPIVLNRLRGAFYERIMGADARGESPFRRLPAALRRGVRGWLQQAERAVLAMEAGQVSGFLRWPSVALCRLLFGRAVRRRLGSPRFVVVGGAKPSLLSMAFLDVMGIRCLQGWGMTETTGPLAVCQFNDRFRGAYGTCGGLFSRTRGYLDGEELIIEGPQVAQGYLEPDGTFVPFNGIKRTGDHAEFDRRGRLRVIGKVSDRITLSNGLNYNPTILEEAICAADLRREHRIEEAVVVGDGQARLGCVFFLRDPLNRGPAVHAYLGSLVRELNSRSPVDEQIGPWASHPQALRDSEFLGPSGKIRRRLVEERFRHLFEERCLEEAPQL